LPKKLGGRTTLFLSKGWPATPYWPYGGGRSHPSLWGWSGHLERPKKKPKKWVWILGVARPPPRAWGWLWPPPTTGRWCPKPPPGPRRWSGHPQRPKPFFFFFFGLSGWPDHPQRPGVASATPIPAVWGWPKPPPYRPYGGGRSHPLDKNGVARPPHFWEGGGSSHPDFLSSSFFFFFFQFPSFFQKKKNPKICKTTPFCPKRRRFGRAQNVVVLEWRV
jgi:hypothetical protein